MEYKIGDKVRCSAVLGDMRMAGFNVGDVHTVEDIDDDYIYVWLPDDSPEEAAAEGWWCDTDAFVPATPSNSVRIAERKRAHEARR